MSNLGDKMVKKCVFHLHTLWLFNSSDLLSIVLPSTAFGVFNGLAVSLATVHTPHLPLLSPSPTNLLSPSETLSRTPLALLWTWINLLSFSVNNQLRPEAIREDAINKPWRPMPSQRLSSESARRLLFISWTVAILTSLALGNLSQCLALIFLEYLYDNLGGADASCLTRNLLNAGGFTCFSSGALQAILDEPGSSGFFAFELLGWWSLVIAAIVLTTVHIQDMYDQLGDAARNRQTVPLVIGDTWARWSIAVPIAAVWCWLPPWLWRSSPLGYVGPVSLGLTVVLRILTRRSVPADKTTFRIWNSWLVSLYLLPLASSLRFPVWLMTDLPC